MNFEVNQLGPSATSEPKGADWSGIKQNNVFFFENEQVNSLNDIEGYTEWKDNQLAENSRVLGKGMEVVGDVTKLGGIVVTPFAPQVGMQMIKYGGMTSLAGVGLQVSADLKQEKYEDAVTNIGLEVVTGVVSKVGQDAVIKSNLEDVSKKVLNSQIEAGIEATKTVIKKELEQIRKKDEESNE